jgi:hypothetical protein
MEIFLRVRLRAELCALFENMDSPVVRHFEVSTLDTEATLQKMKDTVASEMKEKIEAETGAKDVRVTFRALTEARPGLVMNIVWGARADFDSGSV